MIGKQAVPRGNSKQLAAYLMQQEEKHADKLANYLTKSGKNEVVRVLDIEGCASRNVAGAMREMSDIAALSNCKQYIFHMAFRTPEGVSMTDDQKMYAVDTYEKMLGLEGHQRVVVVHQNDNHDHVHIAWNRVDTETSRATNMSFSKFKIHAASRIIEYDLGHDYVQSRTGSHKAICGILKDNNRADVAGWVEGQHEPEKVMQRSPTHREEEQAKRKNIDIEQISKDCTEAWKAADSGKAFANALAERGYILARGEKRDFVIVDGAGGVHSPARRIDGIRTKDIKDKCDDLDKMSLPDPAQAKEEQASRQVAVQERKTEKLQAFEEQAAARKAALERTQQLREGRQEKHIETHFSQKEKQVLEKIKAPEPEAPLGVLGNIYEKVAKTVNPKFKTRSERQKEKEIKHSLQLAEKKKQIEKSKQEFLKSQKLREENHYKQEKSRLDKELESKKEALKNKPEPTQNQNLDNGKSPTKLAQDKDIDRDR